MPPPRPPVAAPLPRSKLPLFPLFEVPEENVRRPLAPAAPAFGVCMIADPDDEAVPSPDSSLIRPPVAVVDEPARRLIVPPAPLVPLPTPSVTAPPRPAVAAPLPMSNVPLLPPRAVPEEKTRWPLAPATPAFPV